MSTEWQESACPVCGAVGPCATDDEGRALLHAEVANPPTPACEACDGYGVLDGLEPCPANCRPEVIAELSLPPERSHL